MKAEKSGAVSPVNGSRFNVRPGKACREFEMSIGEMR